MVSYCEFLHFFFFPSFCIRCTIVMEEEELDLTPVTVTSTLVKEKAHQLEEKFNFMMDNWLEVLDKDEQITDGMAMRVTIHEKSLNARLRIPMLLAMADLL